MANKEGQVDPRRGREIVADLAQQAIEAFRTDSKKDYDQLVKSYEGCSAVVGIFGLGSVTIAVSGGAVHVNPSDRARGTKLIARGAAYPETIVALSEARLTPLEAFHTGDIVVRAESEELHKAYGLMVKMSEGAIRSERLQGVLKRFRAATHV
jgi:hypothetical protein